MGILDSMLTKVIANQFSLADKAKALTQNTTANGGQSVYNSGGQYSPSNPLPPQHEGYNPWQYQYTVGSNLVITPRTEREGALIPFNVLRDVAENHDITALCIKMMIDQVCGDTWDIVVADKNDREHYEDDIKKVKEFFSRPDKVHLFNDWLKPILYDCLSIDAACMFKRRTRNGKLFSLEYVDGSCYSDDTEVLTKAGWKLFKDVDMDNDLFATRNMETKKFEWQKAHYYHVADWDSDTMGDMIHFKTRSLDVLVSPNHRMLVDSLPRCMGGSRHRKGEIIVKAGELADAVMGKLTNVALPATSVWEGREIETFHLDKTSIRSEDIDWSGDDYCAFMGMYLSEGSFAKDGKNVYITQKETSKGYEPFKTLLTRILGKEPCYTGKNFVIAKKPLRNYLSQFGHALDKFVPDGIKNATPRQLEIFWHYYMLGDGHYEHGGKRSRMTRQRISTSSTRMAGDLQEIAQKMGYSASIHTDSRHRDCIMSNDRVIKGENCHERYVVSLRTSKKQLIRVHKEAYKGKIYCVSVPNEILYVRRSGQPTWCGNTIKPLIDTYGRTPLPPYAAYQQIVYGYPYGSSDKAETKELGFTIDEISYRPRYPRTYSRYGTSPIENILMKINIALRRDTVNLAFYTDGTTPDGGIFTFDKPDMTVDQIEQFATLYNDIMCGRLKERMKLKFLPKGTYTATKEHKFDVEYDEWIARVVAIAFGVNPQQFVMLMNRSTGQLQDEQQTELGLAPLENFLNEWFTDIIQNDLGFPHLRFAYVGEKREDAAMSIKRDVDFVQSGILTIDEVRSQRGMPPITGLKDGTPPLIKVGNDVILLTEEYINAKTQAQIEALQYGNVQAGNQSDLQNKIREARAAETSQEGEEAPSKGKDDKEVEQDKKDTQKAIENEMRDFRRYVINRLKKKSHGKRKFETEVIPLEIRDDIYERLEKAETLDDVDDIFDSTLWELQVEAAKKQSQEDIQAVFDDIQQEIIDNLEGLSEEDMQTGGSAKRYLLLLLLLGGINYKEKIDDIMRTVLVDFADVVTTQAISEIRNIGGKVTKAQRKKVIDEYINERMEFLDAELVRVTEEKLGNLFAEATTVDEIKAGLATNYALSENRAKIIANTEFHTLQNEVTTNLAESTPEVYAMFVTDGVRFDVACAEANGSVWSVEYASANPLEHPNCVRQFHPVGKEFVEAWGGIDEE